MQSRAGEQGEVAGGWRPEEEGERRKECGAKKVTMGARRTMAEFT